MTAVNGAVVVPTPIQRYSRPPIDSESQEETAAPGAMWPTMQHLRNNHSGGPSGIRGEHLKGWMAAVEAGCDDKNWQKLVELVQIGFEQYWDKQQIIVKASGYHGTPFQATRGVTQGDPVPPTIFNIMVDAVIRYWLSLACGKDASRDGLCYEVKEQCVLFYADDELLSARNKDWVQDSFDILIRIFERVGLRMNISKTQAMICTPGHISGGQSTSAYQWRMTGIGENYQERQRRQVVCPDCDVCLAQSSLTHHMWVQHGRTRTSGLEPMEAFCEPVEYQVFFPKTVHLIDCPIKGCPGKATSRANLRAHFMYQHVPCRIHHPSHTAMCRSGADRKGQRLVLDEACQASEHVLMAKGVPLDTVPIFKYLGRLLSNNDGDWPAVDANLCKAQKSWARISLILARDGATPRVSGMFYKAVVQSILLFGSETWVMTNPMLKALESFHRWVDRRISGKQLYLNRQTGE
eukprot:scaffold8023_cov54-Attheya_sp.AAC.7